MASSVLDIIQAICPGLYADTVNRDIFIEMATERTNSCFYKSKYNQAIALRASHTWALAQRGSTGDSGQISSKKEGDLQVSFSTTTMNSDDSDLSLTHYGIQLQGLMNAGSPAISVINGCQSILNICD